MSAVRVRHTGIVVRDMTRSLGFYQDLLGLRFLSEDREKGPYIDRLLGLSGAEVWWVKLGDEDGRVAVELLKYLSDHGRSSAPGLVSDMGCSHLALTVDDLDGLYERMSLLGVRFTSPPLLNPQQTVKVTFCFDPDGTPIELVEVLDRQ